MPIFTCICGKNLKVRDELAGKRVKCPDCGNIGMAPAAESAKAPERNRFLPDSHWNKICNRPVTEFEARILKLFVDCNHGPARWRHEDQHRKKLDDAKAAFAPWGPTEVPIDAITDGVVGCVFTTQGIYWLNPGEDPQHIVYGELEPGTVRSERGTFKSYLIVEPDCRMDVSKISLNGLLTIYEKFLAGAIEMAQDDPASLGPTENALAGASAAYATMREKADREEAEKNRIKQEKEDAERAERNEARRKSLHAFLAKRLPDKKFLFAGLGIWESGITAEKIAANVGAALFGTVLFGVAASAPKTTAVGIFAVTAGELCIITFPEVFKPDSIDFHALLKTPKNQLEIKSFPRKSVKAEGFNEKDFANVVRIETDRTITVVFPPKYLANNDKIAGRIAERFKG